MDARARRKERRDLVERRSADRESRGRNKKHVSAFRKFRRKIGAALIESLAPWVLRAIARTWRVERTGEPGQELMKSDRPWICTMWHGRMLTMMPIRLHCRRGLSVLVSPSDDGGLAKRALDKFGYLVVRGSLSKRGARAMREMHEVLEQGGQLVITPDGPRGPRHSINTGAAWLARATGAPILPVFTLREGRRRYVVHLFEALVPERTRDRARDQRVLAEAFAARLEEIVRGAPDQWFRLGGGGRA